jgi:hypothetical protein
MSTWVTVVWDWGLDYEQELMQARQQQLGEWSDVDVQLKRQLKLDLIWQDEEKSKFYGTIGSIMTAYSTILIYFPPANVLIKYRRLTDLTRFPLVISAVIIFHL